MDVPLVIKHRLKELGLDQKELAAAVQVTESYISQLLARKKTPPASGRTDIYQKMGKFLRLPDGELSKLADLQRHESLKRKVAEPPQPLFEAFRGFLLRKCRSEKQGEIRSVFEKEPFGELERLATQKLLDVAKRIGKQELESEEWLQLLSQLTDRPHDQIRTAFLEFLHTDVFNVSVESCVFFLDPLVDSWDIDLKTFGLEIAINRRLTFGGVKRFAFVESDREERFVLEPGMEEFLKDKSLSGDANQEELEFLRRLTFNGKRPAPLYYYRELQNLRDPLHFRS